MSALARGCSASRGAGELGIHMLYAHNLRPPNVRAYTGQHRHTRRKPRPSMPRPSQTNPFTENAGPQAGKDSAALRRKSTNVTLSVALVDEAKALGINLSQAAEVGVAGAVARKRAEVWRAENREALESSNAFVETHGLPLDRYRNF